MSLQESIVEYLNDLSRGMEERTFYIGLWEENIGYAKLAVHLSDFQDQVSVSLNILLIKCPMKQWIAMNSELFQLFFSRL